MLDSGQSEPQIKLDGQAMLLHNCQHTLSLCVSICLFFSRMLWAQLVYTNLISVRVFNHLRANAIGPTPPVRDTSTSRMRSGASPVLLILNS